MIGSDELVPMLADPRSGLSVTPLIDAAGQIGEGSIDIRLGPDIIVSPRATGAVAFDPMDPRAFQRNVERRQQYVRRGIGDPFPLQPGEFVIARSLEYITLPRDVSAEALGRSSWGRLGLVIATATLIQPGFRGTITLELANVGDTPIVLEVGLSIAQLVFSREDSTAALAKKRKSGLSAEGRQRVKAWRARHRRLNEGEGRYNLQIKPAHSRLHKDRDFVWVTPIAIRYAVGVVGERYSGKSTIVDFLVSRRHFRLYHLTQCVYDEAIRRGEDAQDRTVLREIGDSLREEHGEAILAQRTFEKVRQELLDPECGRDLERVVVTGFRHAAELKAWEALTFFRPIVVTAPVSTRRKRARHSGRIDDLEGYPKGRGRRTEEERDAWFEANVDATRSDIWKSAQGAVEIVNDFENVNHLQGRLKEIFRELERGWRSREY